MTATRAAALLSLAFGALLAAACETPPKEDRSWPEDDAPTTVDEVMHGAVPYSGLEFLRKGALRDPDEKDVTDTLIRLSKAEDDKLRSYVALLLGRAHPLGNQLGSDPRPVLSELAFDPDQDVRLAVVRALASQDTPFSRRLLWERAHEDARDETGARRPPVVTAARDALQQWIHPDQLDALLADPREAIQPWADEAALGIAGEGGAAFAVTDADLDEEVELQLPAPNETVRVILRLVRVDTFPGAYFSADRLNLDVSVANEGFPVRGPSRQEGLSPYVSQMHGGEYGWLEVFARYLGGDRVRVWARLNPL